ncbi:MAG TPA: CocE/NonD family hydrolase [Actinomycetota bacterium]|nr:CocE/NonD family hydrolase [Actinomycetota bacterium]
MSAVTRSVVPRRLGALVVCCAMVATLLVAIAAEPAQAAPNTYVRMSDGVLIALNVRMPDGYKKGEKVPTIFEMSGYDGGSASGDEPYAGEGSRVLTKQFYDDYATVHASVRGTGCSGGEFDLFSWRSALDGRELIGWIADQNWSNGDIGIYGHSYGGITGFMVAATRPPELDAVSVSGLIDDLYRGIVYPGGVSNYGFPLLWTGIVRPAYDYGGGLQPGLRERQPECAQATTTKSRTVLNDPILQGIQDTDNSWMQARSLINYAERIDVPIHISGAYQDEQTGPRGPYHLFEEVTNAPVRHLLMSNGNHGTQQSKAMERRRKAFLDHFLLGRGSRPARTNVTTLLEMVDDKPNGVMENRTFPLETTDWTNLYLGPDGSLSPNEPGPKGGSDSYFSGSMRQSWSYQAGHKPGAPFTTADGPDQITYATKKFRTPTAIVGPATATLYVSATAPDTELFVQVIDEAPDGTRYYVQRGMLKASHRAIMGGLSDRLGDGRIYRPHRPHTNPTPIEPGKTYEYLVEIFPFGHVFRPGHRLVVKVHAPPIVDSYYAYVPKRPVSINTVLHDKKHPSHLMLPFVPLRGVQLGAALESCSLTAVRCV